MPCCSSASPGTQPDRLPSHNWYPCAGSVAWAVFMRATPNRRSEIVRAKDNVSDYSGAWLRGALAEPGLAMWIEVDVPCRLQDGMCA
jgi:hypothetical protein